MTSKEIVKLFREGLSIERLTEKEWAEQKESRKERQAAYRKQTAHIKAQQAKDKDFKIGKGNRIVVGAVCTRFMAQGVVEKAIYDDLMNQSKAG